MFTFRTTTIFFFLVLAGMNILALTGTHVDWYYYAVLVLVYLIVSGSASFFISSGFHLKAYCRAKTTQKIFSLTFDDGPDVQITPDVLDILKEKNVKATFFLIGRKLSGNEDIVRRIIDEGHTVGTHSYSHSNWFDFYTSPVMKKEFRKTADQIFRITGKKPLFFRPPYGVINPMVKKALSGFNYHVIGFSNRLFDTVKNDPQKTVDRFLKQLKPGDITVLHDTRPATPSIVKKITETIKEKEFEIVPLGELLQITPYEN